MLQGRGHFTLQVRSKWVVVVVAMDESEQSFHALEWVLEHMGPSLLAPYKLLLLHAKMFTTITPNQGKLHNVNVVAIFVTIIEVSSHLEHNLALPTNT